MTLLNPSQRKSIRVTILMEISEIQSNRIGRPNPLNHPVPILNVNSSLFSIYHLLQFHHDNRDFEWEGIRERRKLIRFFF
jgi:hypothetical protein